MHILLAHNDYGSFSGEEEVMRTISTLLESHGHKITPFRRSSKDIGDSLLKKMHALFSGIYSFNSRNRIAQILNQGGIDIVEVQNLFPFISPSILPVCKRMHVPVVMLCPNYRLFCPNGLHLSHGKICERCLGGKEWHCILQNCERDIFKSFGYAARNAFARVTRMITDNVTIFVVLSEFQKARFIDSGIPPERIAVLPNIAPDVEMSENASIGDTVSFVGRSFWMQHENCLSCDSQLPVALKECHRSLQTYDLMLPYLVSCLVKPWMISSISAGLWFSQVNGSRASLP